MANIDVMDSVDLERWIQMQNDVVETYYRYAARGVVAEEGETRDGMRADRALQGLGIFMQKREIYELLGRGWSWRKVVREVAWKLHFPSHPHDYHSNGERGNLTINMFPHLPDATSSGLEGRLHQIGEVFKHWNPSKDIKKKLKSEAHSIEYELFNRRRLMESNERNDV